MSRHASRLPILQRSRKTAAYQYNKTPSFPLLTTVSAGGKGIGNDGLKHARAIYSVIDQGLGLFKAQVGAV